MPMKLTGIRLSEELKQAGRMRAKESNRSFGSYVRNLIARDAGYSADEIKKFSDEGEESGHAKLAAGKANLKKAKDLKAKNKKL